ncbi:MAG: DMT family transporter [Chloroflexi bacterium]|nr:DMT family transporter [Chloroflexota bacterium]
MGVRLPPLLKPERLGLTYGLMLAAVAGWGGNWVAGKLAGQQFSPLFVALARYVLVLAVLVPWLALQRQLTPIRRRDLVPLIGMGLSYAVGNNLMFLVGLQLAPSSDGALIAPSVAPILAASLAVVAFGEPITRAYVAGCAVATLGLALLIGVEGEASGHARLLGDGLFLGAGACWAIQIVFSRALGNRQSSVVAFSYSALFGCLALVPLALLDGGWRALPGPGSAAWLTLAYVAVGGTALPLICWYQGVQRLGVARSSIFSYLIPVAGVAASMVLLGERLHALQYLGGVLVFCGVALVNRRK